MPASTALDEAFRHRAVVAPWRGQGHPNPLLHSSKSADALELHDVSRMRSLDVTNILDREDSRPAPKVCIIGAGVTGLCACKHLLQQGVECVVLEAQSDVGGVWRNTFASTKLQTPRDAFQFSDFLWRKGTPRLPSHAQVMSYLRSYARYFNVMERIQFNSIVVEVRRLDDAAASPPPSALDAFEQAPASSNWAVCVRRDDQTEGEWLFFEYLVLCVGHYGDLPKYPTFPPSNGPAAFRGKVLHSLDYSLLKEDAVKELLSAKRVVVIGSRKSALDAVVEAANCNRGLDGKTATLLYKTAHWVIAHHNFYGIPMSYMTSRISQLLVPQPGDEGSLLGLVRMVFSPLRWAISKAMEHYLLSSLPLAEHGFVSDLKVFEEFKSCQLTLLPERFFERVTAGHINLRKTTADWCFYEDGLLLPDGEKIESDVVVLCTGYEGEKKLKSLLGMRFYDLLQERDGSIPLFRGVIPPRIPHLAVLGFQESYSNLFTAEMGARWTAHWIAGKISLPSSSVMEKEAQRWLLNTKPFTTVNEKTCVNSTLLSVADLMCKDMGWNHRRKRTLWQELFAPYGNMDYKES